MNVSLPDKRDIVVREEPALSPQDLWDFYVQNDCCETRYGFERATSVIAKSAVVVTARDEGKLVGVARAITDGLDASIMELSVAVSHQGPGAHAGPLVEEDIHGVGRRLAQTLVEILFSKGVCFVQIGAAYKSELDFYKSCGFALNTDHFPLYIDRRPPWKG